METKAYSNAQSLFSLKESAVSEFFAGIPVEHSNPSLSNNNNGDYIMSCYTGANKPCHKTVNIYNKDKTLMLQAQQQDDKIVFYPAYQGSPKMYKEPLLILPSNSLLCNGECFQFMCQIIEDRLSAETSNNTMQISADNDLDIAWKKSVKTKEDEVTMNKAVAKWATELEKKLHKLKIEHKHNNIPANSINQTLVKLMNDANNNRTYLIQNLSAKNNNNESTILPEVALTFQKANDGYSHVVSDQAFNDEYGLTDENREYLPSVLKFLSEKINKVCTPSQDISKCIWRSKTLDLIQKLSVCDLNEVNKLKCYSGKSTTTVQAKLQNIINAVVSKPIITNISVPNTYDTLQSMYRGYISQVIGLDFVTLALASGGTIKNGHLEFKHNNKSFKLKVRTKEAVSSIFIHYAFEYIADRFPVEILPNKQCKPCSISEVTNLKQEMLMNLKQKKRSLVHDHITMSLALDPNLVSKALMMCTNVNDLYADTKLVIDFPNNYSDAQVTAFYNLLKNSGVKCEQLGKQINICSTNNAAEYGLYISNPAKNVNSRSGASTSIDDSHPSFVFKMPESISATVGPMLGLDPLCKRYEGNPGTYYFKNDVFSLPTQGIMMNEERGFYKELLGCQVCTSNTTADQFQEGLLKVDKNNNFNFDELQQKLSTLQYADGDVGCTIYNAGDTTIQVRKFTLDSQQKFTLWFQNNQKKWYRADFDKSTDSQNTSSYKLTHFKEFYVNSLLVNMRWDKEAAVKPEQMQEHCAKITNILNVVLGKQSNQQVEEVKQPLQQPTEAQKLHQWNGGSGLPAQGNQSANKCNFALNVPNHIKPKIQELLGKIKQGTASIGKKLQEQLQGKDLKNLTIDEFIVALFKTRNEPIYLEGYEGQNAIGVNKKFTKEEYDILRYITPSIDVKAFNNGNCVGSPYHDNPGAEQDGYPQKVTLIAGNGILNKSYADKDVCTTKQQAIAEVEKRILDILTPFNESCAKEKKNGYITISPLGCGVWGFDKALFQQGVANVLKNNNFTNIKDIWCPGLIQDEVMQSGDKNTTLQFTQGWSIQKSDNWKESKGPIRQIINDANAKQAFVFPGDPLAPLGSDLFKSGDTGETGERVVAHTTLGEDLYDLGSNLPEAYQGQHHAGMYNITPNVVWTGKPLLNNNIEEDKKQVQNQTLQPKSMQLNRNEAEWQQLTMQNICSTLGEQGKWRAMGDSVSCQRKGSEFHVVCSGERGWVCKAVFNDKGKLTHYFSNNKLNLNNAKFSRSFEVTDEVVRGNITANIINIINLNSNAKSSLCSAQVQPQSVIQIQSQEEDKKVQQLKIQSIYNEYSILEKQGKWCVMGDNVGCQRKGSELHVIYGKGELVYKAVFNDKGVLTHYSAGQKLTFCAATLRADLEVTNDIKIDEITADVLKVISALPQYSLTNVNDVSKQL